MGLVNWKREKYNKKEKDEVEEVKFEDELEEVKFIKDDRYNGKAMTVMGGKWRW